MASTKVPIELSSTPGIVDNSNATAITIDSSENVGIGTSNPTGTLDVTSSSGSGGPSIRVSATGAPTDSKYWAIQSSPSDLAWGTLALRPYNDSGTLKNNGLVINSSGNVGIGTSSPSSYYSKSLVVSAANEDGITIVAANGATTYANYLMFADGTTGNEAYRGWLGYDHLSDSFNIASHGFLRIYSGPTTQESMRITSNGEFLLNRTSIFGTGNTCSAFIEGKSTAAMYVIGTNTSGYQLITFFNGSLNVMGSITHNNTSVTYGTSSDYRLKENVVELDGAIDRVKLLQPKRFNFIADAENTVDGFLAHEVADVVPEAITGIKDEVDNEGNPKYQNIDQSKLVPLLAKAIQEQQVLIEQLQAEVALLKGE